MVNGLGARRHRDGQSMTCITVVIGVLLMFLVMSSPPAKNRTVTPVMKAIQSSVIYRKKYQLYFTTLTY